MITSSLCYRNFGRGLRYHRASLVLSLSLNEANPSPSIVMKETPTRHGEGFDLDDEEHERIKLGNRMSID